ncbi:MAG: substrate-binding domain-containing protein [Treponema sp.]
MMPQIKGMLHRRLSNSSGFLKGCLSLNPAVYKKKNQRFRLLQAAFLLFLCCCAGCVLSCSGQEQAAESTVENAGSRRFMIGYCINNINDVFQVQILDAVKAAVIEAGGEIEISNADEDSLKQRNQVSNFIERRVDGLIVVPVDASAAAVITDIVHLAGIPLCYVNRNPFQGKEHTMPDGVYFAGSEQIIAGRLQADYAGKLLNGRGNVAILTGVADDTGTVERTKGNKEIFAEKYPNITIVAEESAGLQGTRISAIIRRWLEVYGKELNAILANSDEIAGGVIQALYSAGADHILVLGIDGTIEGKAAVQQGKMAATVFQDAESQGVSAAKIIVDAIQGKHGTKISLVPFRLLDKITLILQEAKLEGE